MSEHMAKIIGGVILVGLGTVLVNSESGLGLLGVLLNLVGGVILLVGVVGAGVQAGNREVVEELRRPRGSMGEDRTSRDGGGAT